MADTAFQIQYRQEFIAGFEQHVSLLSKTLTTEAVIKGNTATFLVADSGGATAVTRGVNGLIPARPDNLTQTSATLLEWHDLVRKTGFNIFASQGDQRRIMQMTTMGVINRKIDTDILAMLDAGVTNHAGAATTASLNLIVRALAILGVNQVPTGNNVSVVISPAFWSYLMEIKEFASADYVNGKPFENPRPYNDQPTSFTWMGMTWIVSPLISGVGTAAELCYMYHRSAAGHAVAVNGIQTPVGYNEEQDYSYARASVYMGNVMLQVKGVVQMIHDGSAFVAT
jgi:hypothetical protein